MIKNYILADNQELTRYSLEHLIRQNEENVVHICSDKRDLMQLLEKHENSIVLLDYSLFNFVDEEQLLIFSERFSTTSWILVSEELTIKFIRKVLYSSHAFSIVLKDCGLRDFREALKSVSQGQRYICQQVMEILLTQQQQEETPDVLTSTELEIAKLICQGKTTKEIATERFSSVHTITTHRKNIFRKLRVNTAHELLRYAMRSGWINASEFTI